MRCRVEQAAICRAPRNLVIHTSCEALHQAIAATKEVRAGSPADQQSEQTRPGGAIGSGFASSYCVHSSAFTRHENSFVCLLGAMDAFGAERSIVDEG